MLYPPGKEYGGKQMTPKDETTDPSDMSLTEVNETLHHVIRSLKFHEGMLTDVMQMLAEVDPEAIDKLRVQAAVALDQVHADRYTCPMADERESYWRKRFLMIDLVLARRGSYFKTAEVVSLGSSRQR